MLMTATPESTSPASRLDVLLPFWCDAEMKFMVIVPQNSVASLDSPELGEEKGEVARNLRFVGRYASFTAQLCSVLPAPQPPSSCRSGGVRWSPVCGERSVRCSLTCRGGAAAVDTRSKPPRY